MRRAATDEGAKSVFVGAACCFYEHHYDRSRVRGALATTNWVLETFEISCLRKLLRDFGFLFSLTEITFRVFYGHFAKELNWLLFCHAKLIKTHISQAFLQVHDPSIYALLHFPPDCTMINVLSTCALRWRNQLAHDESQTSRTRGFGKRVYPLRVTNRRFY